MGNPPFDLSDPFSLSLMANGAGGPPSAQAADPNGGRGGNDLGSMLFPAPEAESFLDPHALKRIRSLALLQAGAKLLEGAKGPQGTLNFGRSLGQALDQGPFEDMLGRLMQQRQWEMQFAGYDAIRQALAANPEPKNEDPEAAVARLTNVGQRLMETGNPFAMQQGQAFLNAAKTRKDVIPDVDRVENVPGSPNGPYAGQNVVQIRNKHNGNIISEYPYKQNMTPQERLNAQLAFTNDFDQHMGPLNTAATAWQGYKALQGRTDIGADRLRQQYARTILDGGRSLGVVDAASGQIVDQILAAIGRDPKGLSPEARQTLDSQVAAIAPKLQQVAQGAHRSRMRIIQGSPELGLDPSDYPNLWDVPAPAPPKPRPAARPGSATELIER